MEIGQITANCLALVEVLKRFVPSHLKSWLIPLISIGLGGAMGYSSDGMNGILSGIVAGSASVTAYKVPKMMENKMVEIKKSKKGKKS